MRIYLKILFLFFITGCSVSSFAGNPTAVLNYASFVTSSGQNYFETYLSVAGNSMIYVKNSNNKFVATAHITLSFKLGDSVLASANFNLHSSELTDTSVKPDFLDTHRFWLRKGNYTLVFTLDDPNNPSRPLVTGKQPVRVGYRSDSICVSDVEFLSSFTPSDNSGPYTKYGYSMIPYIYRDYPPSIKKLAFYCEIYNAEKITGPDEKVLIKYVIEDDGNYTLDYSKNPGGSVTMHADSVIQVLAQMPIVSLAPGNYSLLISVIDKNNHTLAKRRFNFTRENPGISSPRVPPGFAPYFANRDTLEESVRCLYPISQGSEQDVTIGDSIKSIPTPELTRFFYYFWLTRDSVYPLEAWKSYLDKVIAVNHTFAVPGVKGYKTDRGRVYLHYGAPNHRIVSKHNPSTYPYEIWHYYKLPDGQVDIRFVFYDRDLVTNNYTLIQSTAIGETQNPQWQYILYSRLGSAGSVDAQTVQDDLGENVNDEYNDPH